jgi:Spy/CpxP family protein refolding chaperone
MTLSKKALFAAMSFAAGVTVGFIATVKSVNNSIQRNPGDWITFIVEENAGETADVDLSNDGSQKTRRQMIRAMKEKRRRKRMKEMAEQVSASFDINAADIDENPFTDSNDADDGDGAGGDADDVDE